LSSLEDGDDDDDATPEAEEEEEAAAAEGHGVWLYHFTRPRNGSATYARTHSLVLHYNTTQHNTLQHMMIDRDAYQYHLMILFIMHAVCVLTLSSSCLIMRLLTIIVVAAAAGYAWHGIW